MIRKTSFAVLVGAAAIAATSSLHADLFLPTRSTWEYTFVDPTGDPTWNTTTGGWTTGPAPFGKTSDPIFGAGGTVWPESSTLGDDLWVRTTVDLSAAVLTTVTYDLGVDNGFKLYLNGDLVAADNAEGFTSVWEYTGSIPSGSLVSGLNVVALALEDHGALTAFDMQISAARTRAVVPEASTVLSGIAIAGLAGLGWQRQRRTR